VKEVTFDPSAIDEFFALKFYIIKKAINHYTPHPPLPLKGRELGWGYLFHFA